MADAPDKVLDLQTMISRLDLVSADLAHQIRKAAQVRGEAEKMREMLASDLAQVAREAAESPEVGAATAILAEDGEEERSAEHSPEEPEETGKLASAEISQGEAAPREESSATPTFLELCMSNPQFRARLVSRLKRKLR